MEGRTDARSDFRLDLPERNGRTGRQLTAAVVPLVTDQGGRDPDMRVVVLLDGSRRKVETELMRMREYTIPRREVGVLIEAARASFSPSTLIGKSAAMQHVRAQVIEAAHNREPALIVGPPDGGKQHAARAVHFEGEAGGPFLPINCAGLAPENLETELFGVVKGATPEAVVDRPGVFQLADHGTVYLENVDALTDELQERVEEAMRSGRVRRKGGKRQERIEVRVIASAERDLRAAVREGSFRASLLELLVSREIHIPGLRDRSVDVVPLAEYLIERYGGGRTLALSPAAQRQLAEHDWPGKVRELSTCIQRAS